MMAVDKARATTGGGLGKYENMASKAAKKVMQRLNKGQQKKPRNRGISRAISSDKTIDRKLSELDLLKSWTVGELDCWRIGTVGELDFWRIGLLENCIC